jgi:hypothetical protein
MPYADDTRHPVEAESLSHLVDLSGILPDVKSPSIQGCDADGVVTPVLKPLKPAVDEGSRRALLQDAAEDTAQIVHFLDELISLSSFKIL